DRPRQPVGRPPRQAPPRDPTPARRAAARRGAMKLVRTLDRYVAREFLRLFLLATIAVPVLFVLGDLMDNLDKHMDRGRTIGQLARYYVFQSPLFIQYSFPIASLLATVFTVNNM